MSVFVTGGTGYLGSYAIQTLLHDTDTELALLVRAPDRETAVQKLWRAWQLHMDAARFADELSRVDVVYGDLHAPDLGIDPKHRKKLAKTVDSVLHIAASLNRKSAKACLNTNLRGTLSVIKLAEAAHKKRKRKGGLRRYSHVSTVAVAGHATPLVPLRMTQNQASALLLRSALGTRARQSQSRRRRNGAATAAAMLSHSPPQLPRSPPAPRSRRYLK